MKLTRKCDICSADSPKYWAWSDRLVDDVSMCQECFDHEQPDNWEEIRDVRDLPERGKIMKEKIMKTVGIMKFEIGDIVRDEDNNRGMVVIKWNDGDICALENDAAHPNPVITGHYVFGEKING